MATGSLTSPIPGSSAQFFPGFLVGNLPTPVSRQSGPSLGFMEAQSTGFGGGSPSQPMASAPNIKSGAPPVGSIFDNLLPPSVNSTPLSSRKLTSFTAGSESTPSSPYTSLDGSAPQPTFSAPNLKRGAPPVGSIFDNTLLPGVKTTPLSSRNPTSFTAGIESTPSSPFTCGSPPQPMFSAPNMKRGAPPVGSIFDDRLFPALRTSPLNSRKQTSFTAGIESTPSSPYTCGDPIAPASPTSPKPGANAQFLPGFLMGDLPTPVLRQSCPPFGFIEAQSTGFGDGASSQPAVSDPKMKSNAPPVGSIYDDIPGLNASPLCYRKQTSYTVGIPSSPSSPYTSPSVFHPSTSVQSRKHTLSPAEMDPYHTQGDSLTVNDQLDDTWITVYGFPPASASYILQQFAQYGNIVKYVMSATGNWMHIQYQSKLQKRNALSKDGKIFGDSIMIAVKPCTDKSLIENREKTSVSSMYSVLTPPVKSVSSPRSGMRPLAAACRAFTRPYQVFLEKQTIKKDKSLISKTLEYLFGW